MPKESWPTAVYSKNVVLKLADLLKDVGLGEIGNKDIVGKVRLLLAERAPAGLKCGCDEKCICYIPLDPYEGWGDDA